jgi:hypothetical protein
MAGVISNDFKITDEDFDWSSGDFQISESSMEHLNAIMASVTGDYINNPQLGVNLNTYVNSPLGNSTVELQRVISANMKLDGFSVSKLSIKGDLSSSKLNIETSGDRVR